MKPFSLNGSKNIQGTLVRNNWLNNSMEHTTSSDTDSSSGSHEIPCNYGTEDSLQEPTLVPILDKMNPVHTILSYIFMIHFTTILREATAHLILNNACLTHDWTGHCFNKRLQNYYFTNLLGDINFRDCQIISGKYGSLINRTHFLVAFIQNANKLTTDMLTSVACSWPLYIPWDSGHSLTSHRLNMENVKEIRPMLTNN